MKLDYRPINAPEPRRLPRDTTARVLLRMVCDGLAMTLLFSVILAIIFWLLDFSLGDFLRFGLGL